MSGSTEPVSGAEWVPVFYTLPVEQVEEGMSTDDGQDILAVSAWPDDSAWFLDVYTPAEDPAADLVNQVQGECRAYKPGERVGLAVFVDTEIDGSDHPDAVLRTPEEASRAEAGR
ncbi:hypothetical protein [Nocardia sp. NPDC051750]|uniref:hypothetical protein n=1 Tax=Nocardia sp. NPDC051750 TaxID=3364325 RepID=UPI00379BB840